MSTDFPLHAWVTHNGRRRGYITAISTTTDVLYLKDSAGREWAASAADCVRIPGRALEPMVREPETAPGRVGRKPFQMPYRGSTRPEKALDGAVAMYNAKRRGFPQLGSRSNPAADEGGS